MAKLETELWKRSRHVLGMAAGVAGHELKQQLRSRLSSSVEKLGALELRTRIEQAKLLAEGMGRLKGAFMKAGQLLSIDASDLLPPEAVDILSKLQGQAEPVDLAVMRGVLDAELGAERLALLTELEPRPVAAASIGQVYRARAFGTRVAVKVQYPGIADSIDADVDLLQKLGSSWLTLTRRDVDIQSTFQELRTILKLEADYERERRYLGLFQSLLADDPRFVVPGSFDALSTSRVLTMTWEDGVPLSDWVRAAPPMDERVALGRAALDLYCREFFEWGVVQTDPNFGNFLVRPEERRIVLLDFGATVEYDAEFRRHYVGLLRAVARKEDAAIADRGLAFGLIDPRESAETRAAFVEMLKNAAEPFERGRQPFRFGDAAYAARSKEVVQRFVSGLRFSPPPRQLIFLHRKLGGLFQLLKRLDVELDLYPYWERMLGETPASLSGSS